ncbi:MAG: ABC-ATPase domain-containing protein, partial [Myxococcota bacterium]
MSDHHQLVAQLQRLDRKSYKAYSDLRGEYTFPSFTLHLDHVQGDPFAAPSRIRVRVPQEIAGLPEALMNSRIRSVALADWLARQVNGSMARPAPPVNQPTSNASRPRGGHGPRGHGSGKSGLISIDVGGQEVLERTAVKLGDGWVEARMEVGLPAAGRRILAGEAIDLLTRRLPAIVEEALIFRDGNQPEARAFVECVENQEAIRSELASRELVAFVADGARLPRRTGASNAPMPPDVVVPFRSPDSLAIEIELPNALPEDGRTKLRGLGIRAGVTLIVGGGYHGKSTLLSALEHGVYPHIPGDGREYVVSSRDLAKIRSEDGRSVRGVDIHSFIDVLPSGPAKASAADRTRTRSFSTDDASGSTSQAAAIVEAVEAGAKGLLLDEDTSATNFMLRDGRMQKLVHSDHEPITPYVDRVRELFELQGVSTVLVMGGSGDYFDVADCVIMMKNYSAADVTTEARRIAAENDSGRRPEFRGSLEAFSKRCPLAGSLVASRGRRNLKITARSRELILYGEESLDLRHLTQIVDASQTHAIAWAIHLASQHLMDAKQAGADPPLPTLEEILDGL